MRNSLFRLVWKPWSSLELMLWSSEFLKRKIFLEQFLIKWLHIKKCVCILCDKTACNIRQKQALHYDCLQLQLNVTVECTIKLYAIFQYTYFLKKFGSKMSTQFLTFLSTRFLSGFCSTVFQWSR